MVAALRAEQSPAAAEDAVPCMVVEETERNLVQRSLDCRDLGYDVHEYRSSSTMRSTPRT